MPSGKQILVDLLKHCSQRKCTKEDLGDLSENLRAALLLHGSTSGKMWFHVERVGWCSEINAKTNEPSRQGLALTSNGLFISDIFNALVDERMPAALSERYPKLTAAEYRTAIHLIRLLLSSVEWHHSLAPAEIDSRDSFNRAAANRSLRNYREKLAMFRENPKDFLDADDELLAIYKGVLMQ